MPKPNEPDPGKTEPVPPQQPYVDPDAPGIIRNPDKPDVVYQPTEPDPPGPDEGNPNRPEPPQENV